MTEQDWQTALDHRSAAWKMVKGWSGWYHWAHNDTSLQLYRAENGKVLGWKGRRIVAVKECMMDAGVPEIVITWFHLRYQCQ